MTNFGPPINTISSELCISFYASLCDDCTMTFTMKTGNQIKIIKKVQKINVSDILCVIQKYNQIFTHVMFQTYSQWFYTKMIIEGIYEDEIQLYIDTTLTNKSLKSNSFWRIDNVRICSTNGK